MLLFAGCGNFLSASDGEVYDGKKYVKKNFHYTSSLVALVCVVNVYEVSHNIKSA